MFFFYYSFFVRVVFWWCVPSNAPTVVLCRFSIVDDLRGGEAYDSVEYSRAFFTVFEGAIYLHQVRANENTHTLYTHYHTRAHLREFRFFFFVYCRFLIKPHTRTNTHAYPHTHTSVSTHREFCIHIFSRSVSHLTTSGIGNQCRAGCL